MLTARLSVFLAALWWGSLTAVGFMVVPMLFVHLETPAMAGQMAAKLFTAQTWLSLGCCFLLCLTTRRETSNAAPSPLIWVVGGMALALMMEVGVKPHILARDNMALWHNLGSAFYVGQWLCAGKALWQLWPVPGLAAGTEGND